MEPTFIPVLFNYSEAAEMLTMSEKTLRRHVQQGRVPHRKIGRYVRFTEADLSAYIEACAKGGDA